MVRAAQASPDHEFCVSSLLRKKSRAPKGAAAKHTEQSAHQAAIWVALEYAGQCLSKGSKVTLTVESVTALRNLHDAPADEEARPGAAAQGGVVRGAAQTTM